MIFAAGAKTRRDQPVVVTLAADGGRETWRFVEPWSLGANDQSVFLAILALSGLGRADGHTRLAPTTSSSSAALSLKLKGSAANRERECFAVTTTARDIRRVRVGAGPRARGSLTRWTA